MSLVDAAILSGRCSLAVSGALLRDDTTVLALKERSALLPMTLSGVPSSPVVAVSDASIARAIAQPGGVLVLVEPQDNDLQELQKLAQRVGSAKHKPTIVVVDKRFDAFRMQMLFPRFKIEHVKERGPGFLKGLPLPPADQEPVKVEAAPSEKKKAADDAPRFVFVGREEEVAQLTGFMAEPGPMVVSGPPGIGRTVLVEHAIAASGLQRLPELTLGRGVGFDTLIARIAEIGVVAGVSTLAEALKAPHTPAQLVAAAVATLQAAESTSGQVMVVGNLQVAAGRGGDFFRKSRLELLVEALLTSVYPLRLVFLSAMQPVFYREGAAAGLRRLELGGIKGRFFHDIFQAYHAPEFPREKFGPLAEKLHGHPFAARTFALVMGGNVALLDDEKFFRMANVRDVDAIGKQLEKRLERMDDTVRGAAAYLAHLRYPVDGQALADLGINKKLRNALLSAGQLEMIGTEEGQKRFRVHPLVARAYPERMVVDYEILKQVAALHRTRAREAQGVERLALLQEANRCAILSRNPKDVVDVGYPDRDAWIETVTGMIRAREAPRFDLADQRLSEILKADPSNADAHLLRLELIRRADAKPELWKEASDAAMEHAPVPEVFHEVVGALLGRNARGNAIKVLEDAVRALPEQSRLRCRLAALLHRQGRRPEAIEQLKLARDADPMLPDAYGLLGTIYREEGADRIIEAEELIREAVKLAPGDVIQTSRLVWLLLDIHHGVPERRESVAEELKGLLDGLVQADKESWEAHLLYAVSLREMKGDLTRAEWFLGKARKLAPRSRGIDEKLELERALLQVAAGKLDEAERHLHKLAKQDPSNHRVVAGLARIAEARGHTIVAHAELARAAERTSPFSLDRQAYEMEMKRLQQIIAGEIPASAPPAVVAMGGGVEAEAEAEATVEAAEQAEAAEAEEDPQVQEERPVEG